jgi:ATP-dependent DNA ligase
MWWHEIKHDGFRVVARKSGATVRLYSRPGNDLTSRFPLIVETLARLRSRSCIIDGEAVACDGHGLPVFDRLRQRRHDRDVFLFAFDLLELDGGRIFEATTSPGVGAPWMWILTYGGQDDRTPTHGY